MPDTLRSDVEFAQPIGCILSDVDGVMTDGRIIFDGSGVEIKHFHVRDGLGIKRWIAAGFHFAIITGRESASVQTRGEELGIAQIIQGADDKLPVAERLLSEWGLDFAATCYIGDDLPDVPVMQRCGLAAAPADASPDARQAAHWVLHNAGGQGVVRELTERLLRAKGLWDSNRT